MDIITPAIPFFFLLMGLELLVGRARGRRIFHGEDVATCLALGTLQTLFTVVAAGVLMFMYQAVFEHRLIDLPDSAWVWVFGFIGVDFFYYWFHRVSHRSMWAWATHAPHHSSEDYNLAVALRQGPIQPLASRLFYLPLALVGVPYSIFALMVSVNTLYQFWIHTELIGKLGPLEWIFNTPSHHRVHHGCNGRYLDRNHAGIFIIWDRLFGTFVREGDDEAHKPIYGTVKPLTTWNPLLASLAPFVDLKNKVVASSGIADVVRAVFGPPEWMPLGVVAAPAVQGPRTKFSTSTPPAVARYVGVSFVVVLLSSVVYLVFAARLTPAGSLAAAAWLTWSFGSLGALLDRSPLGWGSELARLVVGLPLVAAVIAFV